MDINLIQIPVSKLLILPSPISPFSCKPVPCPTVGATRSLVSRIQETECLWASNLGDHSKQTEVPASENLPCLQFEKEYQPVLQMERNGGEGFLIQAKAMYRSEEKAWLKAQLKKDHWVGSLGERFSEEG